ncbi:glycoside hydrolase family 18 protein [Backusella circina FSU 941]|nr:glycoside hydrolase family 18 protein [Backusella circina FSU 941]
MVVSFVISFNGGPHKSPRIDLSDNCGDLDNCADVARDIKYCQAKGIKVLISVGGSEGPYHKESWDPDLFAWWMWNKFLGGDDRTVSRPFGDAVMDGVDFDPESIDGDGFDRHIHVLRQLFKTQYPPRDYLISSAPQCPDLDYYSKNAVYNILHPAPKYDAYPDLVFVQFYNNYCSASAHTGRGARSDFNFDEWDQWAQQRTQGRAKIYLGILGKENRYDTGYVNYEKLTVILDDIKRHKSFGGVMMWDAGYAYANPVPLLQGLSYGQATAKYLEQLSTGHAKSAMAFDQISRDFRTHQVPVLVPYSQNDTHLADTNMPCKGQSFILLRSVSGRALAESFGIAASTIDAHFQDIGMNVNDPFNPGSRLCLGTHDNDIVLSYVYNATSLDDERVADYYY